MVTRTSPRSWGREWALAIVLCAIILGAWEIYWRTLGFAPSAQDNLSLWCTARERASDGGRSTIAITGSSMLQAAIDVSRLSQLTATKAVQLALTGSSGLPILEDLAHDESFLGIVVVEYNGSGIGLLAGEIVPRNFLRKCERSSRRPIDRFEESLSSFVRTRTVFRLSALAPVQLLRGLARGRWPHVNPITIGLDRELSISWGDAQPAPRVPRGARMGDRIDIKATGTDADREVLRRITDALSMLRRRGADAVFVLPDCHSPMRNEYLERQRVNWEAIVDSNVIAIDLSKLLGDEDVRCPDGVHLDRLSKPRFTEILAQALNARLLERGRAR